MPKHHARALALALSLAALATAPSPAGASSDYPQVATREDGVAHFAWTRNDGATNLIQGRSRAADGTLGEALYVSSPVAGASAPRVAAGAGGAALHTWQSNTPGGATIKLRRRAPDGSFSATQTISGPAASADHQIAVDPDGDAVIVWSRITEGKFVVEARRRAADGTLSPIKRLSAAAPTYSAVAPDVAVDAAGNAVVTWTVMGNPYYVQVRRRAVDGTLSATQNVTSGTRADSAKVGVDAAGNAVIAFRRMAGANTVTQVRRRSAAGALSSITEVGEPHPAATMPEVAVSPDAGAVVAWTESIGGETRVFAARRPPGGSWSEREPVSLAGGAADELEVGIDTDGDAVFAWRRTTPAGAFVQIRRRTAAGVLSPTDDLSPADGEVSRLALAVEPGGGATAAWRNGDTQRAEARRRTQSGELGPLNILSD